MLGYGPSGRGYLLERLSYEEVELTLWRMIWSARQREEEMKLECKNREEDWFKRERGLKDWENELEIRELKLGYCDSGIVKMMKDLRVCESELENRDEEIKELKNEIEDRVMRAREEHKREMKAVLMCDWC